MENRCEHDQQSIVLSEITISLRKLNNKGLDNKVQFVRPFVYIVNAKIASIWGQIYDDQKNLTKIIRSFESQVTLS